jgi:hypothetical protein
MIAVPLPPPPAKVRKVFEIDTLRLDCGTTHMLGLERPGEDRPLLASSWTVVLSSEGVCTGLGVVEKEGDVLEIRAEGCRECGSAARRLE